MKFAALNKEASTSSVLSTPSGKGGRPTLEAQESACLELYHSAIRLQQDGDLSQAKEIYREILESELMEEVGGASQHTTLSKLKYLVYKNVAAIAREQGDLSAAVDSYIEASTIDTSDVTMWCQLASASSLLGNLLLARKALECAMECNDRHWPALEALTTVLFALGDYLSCMLVIKKGLDLDPTFPRGVVYLRHISEHCSDLISQSVLVPLQIYLMKPSLPDGERFLKEATTLQARRKSLQSVEVLPEDIIPAKKMTTLTMYNLANSLLSLYKQCKELSKTKASYIVRVDTTSLVGEVRAIEDPVSSSQSSPVKKLQPIAENLSQPEVGVSGGGVEEGGARKDTKRRLLEELEPFAPKRRSSRVKAKSTPTPMLQKGQSHFQTLSKFIPVWLELSDLPELSSLSPLKKLRDKAQRYSFEEKLLALSDSTLRLNEPQVVKDFVKESEKNFGILDLLKRFLLFLSRRYDHKWCDAPFPVVKLYTDIYECLHPHLTLPSSYCTMEDAQQPSFKNMATVALCYLETYVDCASNKRGSKKSSLVDSLGARVSLSTPKCFTECSNFMSHCAGLVGESDKERVHFALRYVWWKVKWSMLNSDNSTATSLLRQCERMLEAHATVLGGAVAVCLPNLSYGPLISLDEVHDKIKQLEQCVSMNEIHDLYERCEYSAVVDKLLPLFDEDPDPPIEFIIGREKAPSEEKSSLSLLLSCLVQLGRFHACLEMALQATFTLLSQNTHGNEQWAAALKEMFVTIDDCLPPVEEQSDSSMEHSGSRTQNHETGKLCKVNDETESTEKMETNKKDANIEMGSEIISRKDLLRVCDQRLLKRLFVCVIKMLDLVADMADSPLLHTLPVAITWRVFYTLMACKWEAGAGVFLLPPADEAENPLATPTPLEPMDVVSTCTSSSQEPMKCIESVENDQSMDTSSSGSPSVVTTTVTSAASSTVSMANIVISDLPVSSNPVTFQLPSSPPIDMLTTAPITTTSQAANISNLSPPTTQSIPNSAHPTPSSTAASVLSSVPNSSCSTPATTTPCPSSVQSTPSKSPPDTTTRDELPPILRFLIEAHQHLGRMGWCCKERGLFLHLSVGTLRSELKHLLKLPTKHREILLVELEQCYYCLYGHPHKKAKARGIAEHNSPQVPMTWDSALMLIEYFHPSPLPSIDDTKASQVTPELVSLYKRIVNILPQHGKVSTLSHETMRLKESYPEAEFRDCCQAMKASAIFNGYFPESGVYDISNVCEDSTPFTLDALHAMQARCDIKTNKVISKEDLSGLIDGTCTDSMIVRLSPHQHTTTMAEVCYLLADDALKSGYNNNAVQQYQQSLCYCPDQFASWAGLALARTRKIVEKLNIRDVKSGMERYVLKQTAATVRCYEKAVSLDEKHCFVIEKFGFFCYMIQAFSSQILSQSGLYLLKDTHSWASDSLGEMLLLAKKCFTQALALKGSKHSEPWLYQLMLGKIGWKLSQPFEGTMKLLIESCEGLHRDEAGYPDYVELSAKYHALEAIEAHYQLHTYILKTLLKRANEGVKTNPSAEQCLRDYNSRLDSLPLTPVNYPGVWTWVSSLVDKAIEIRTSSEKPRQHEDQNEHFVEEERKISVLQSIDKPDVTTASTTVQDTEEKDVFPVVTLYNPFSKSRLDNTKEESCTSEPCLAAGIGNPHSEPVSKKQFGCVDADLLKKSLYGIAVCSMRCPAYFKSLYRLAATCFEMGLARESREILLGPLPSALVEQQEKLLPLFALKPNFFSNMWQIPTEEINRPGNFSTHARRNLDLLLEVLTRLSDVQSLSYLAQHLKSKPDTTKQYMRDNERAFIFKKAVRCAVQALMSTASSVTSLSQEELRKLQSVASSLKPLSKLDSQKLAKDVDAIIERIKTAIVPTSPPRPSQDKTPPSNERAPPNTLTNEESVSSKNVAKELAINKQLEPTINTEKLSSIEREQEHS